MKGRTRVLLLVVAVIFLGATASPSFLSALKEDISWRAKEITHLLLADSTFDRCSVIFLTDGATDSSSVQQVWRSPNHGGTLFEVEVARDDTNFTQPFIPSLVSQVRRLRLLTSCVMVVVMSNDAAFLAAFAEASDSGRLMVWETRLLVVTKLDVARVQALLRDYWTFSMMNTMFLKLKEDSRWQIFAHLPYTQSGAQVARVATWKPGRRLIVFEGRAIFPEKYNNFYGMPLNLTWLPLTPYFMEIKQTRPDGKQISIYRGREYLIIKAMGAALNFSLYPLPFEGWDNVLRRLRDREAFIWPVNLPILPNMVEEYDFSFFLERSTLAFTMAKPTLKPSWQSLYYPLQIEVWISVGATVLIMFAILPMMNHNRKAESPTSWLVVKLVVGTLLDEAIPGELPRKTSMRLMLTAWLVFAFIVGTVYRSNLTACLTIPKYPPRAETLADLLNIGARVTIVDTMDIFVKSFKQSESHTLRTLTERMAYVPSFKEGMTESLTENSAHLYERLYMEVKIEEHFTSNDGSTPLYVTQESLLADFSAFLMIRDAPFRPKIDYCLMAFHESGLITKWKTQVMDGIRRENRERRKNNILQEREKEKTSDEGRVMSLSLVHLQGPLVLYLLSIIVSFAAFVSEVSVGVYLHRKLEASVRVPPSHQSEALLHF